MWSDIQQHLPMMREMSAGNVLEIGVRQGFSTSALLAGIEDRSGHLYSVDITSCFYIFAGHPHWTFLHADSIKEAARIKSAIPDNLELLFVDGDHTYEGCMSDLENFGPRAKKILVHDCEAPDYPGVVMACERYAKQTKRKFIVVRGSYGMGIIE
jgi:hypothetical protein